MDLWLGTGVKRAVANRVVDPSSQVVDVSARDELRRSAQDLFGGPEVDLEPMRAATDVDGEPAQGDWLAIDTLALEVFVQTLSRRAANLVRE